jgi:hypothetical protein
VGSAAGWCAPTGRRQEPQGLPQHDEDTDQGRARLDDLNKDYDNDYYDKVGSYYQSIEW